MVSFEGFSDFKMKPREINFTISGNVLNPNKSKLKLHPSSVDVYIQQKKLGQLSNEEKIILKRNGTTDISVPVIANTEKGALIQLTALSFKDSVEVKFVGEVKVGMGIFKKKIAINESFKTSTRFLKFKN
ncbi:LEA type 2 family protein [Crocinitomicaceae bacterium]|nr:LEA type 2 family protein [Crocinitomicaceae bacterium]MDC1203073.1 LEA type 2 family protein [Crocinitomicaceae bacterium]MDC1243825.1 LEA type 2 family protein [Crocinitomicaceae bacterium]MDO7610558.1 LEA type 2 family protein [Crocinitomicaceae bacterium]